MLRFRWGIVFAVCLSVTASGFAQSTNDKHEKEGKSESDQSPVQAEKPKDQKQSKSQNSSPRDRVNHRFASQSPKIGQPLPDISAFDDAGKPFKLSSLKGQYTVLVFGCLT